jgi:hypothetical protein
VGDIGQKLKNISTLVCLPIRQNQRWKIGIFWRIRAYFVSIYIRKNIKIWEDFVMKKNKKIDPNKLISLRKKREELARQIEQMRMQMLADLGTLLVESVTKNDLGQLDFDRAKKDVILQIAASLKEIV